MIPIILSGGSGTRLWPVSRSKLPKQFCEIFSDSLQNLTLKRALHLGNPWILTSQDLKDHTEKNLGILIKQHPILQGRVQALYEPMARNTAPALAYLCLTLIRKELQNEVCAVFPSDHLIQNEEALFTALKLAEQEARLGKLCVLGIHPTHPATGYGYIECREEKDGGIRSVVKFYEKPSLERAQQFIKDGNFYWNAGMFVFRPADLLRFFEKYAPEILRPFEELKVDLSNLSQVYSRTKKTSIDYAIVEKLSSDELSCIPCDMGWNDVGTWDSIAEIFVGEARPGTIVEGQAHNNFVHTKTNKVYAFAGVDDLILVDTPDAILVTKKQQTQAVKDITEKLQAMGLRAAEYPLNEERPWGHFEVLKDTESFKSKVITVEPGGQISYQSHNKREEHWMIVSGRGEVIINDQVIPVERGSYVKIPLQAKHRIRNTGKENIVFVEVQLGSYFGEDDIIRYQDDYKRV
jgi:mannose-1-phosphate guanylyltransferase/mannose-6-phosphate isomerase